MNNRTDIRGPPERKTLAAKRLALHWGDEALSVETTAQLTAVTYQRRWIMTRR